MIRRRRRAAPLVGLALLVGVLAIALVGHLVDRTDPDDMRLAERLAAVPDPTMRASLVSVGTLGEGAVCKVDPDRLSRALGILTQTINSLSNNAQAMQSLLRDTLAAGIRRQQEGRGAPCADVETAVRATEQAFRKHGLL